MMRLELDGKKSPDQTGLAGPDSLHLPNGFNFAKLPIGSFLFIINLIFSTYEKFTITKHSNYFVKCPNHLKQTTLILRQR